MRSVGICASDLLYLQVGTEHVLGHELAGVLTDGTPVAVEGLYGCGECEYCLDGQINLCAQSTQRALGMLNDGGMAEQFRAPAQRLVELPAGLDAASGALVEPASVSWHGVRVGGAGPDTRVLVVGAGSVGLLAVAAAQAMGAAEVSLVARHPHQKVIGERLGATEPTASTTSSSKRRARPAPSSRASSCWPPAAPSPSSACTTPGSRCPTCPC